MSANQKDIEDFESTYHKEEKEIIILTIVNSIGSSANCSWLAEKDFLAYVDVNTNKLKKGKGHIFWTLTEEKVKGRTCLKQFKNGCIYRLRVRELIDKTVSYGRLPSYYNRFLVVDVLEENAQNDDLLAFLEEYRKPVNFVDEVMGEFILNKNLALFSGKINWMGKDISVYLKVNADNKGSWTKAVKALRTLFEQQEQNDLEYRAFAAENLTDLANEWNQEEDEDSSEISEQDFIKRISLSSLSVTSGGNFTAYYDDDDMFFGHAVTVLGSIKKGVKSAGIEG